METLQQRITVAFIFTKTITLKKLLFILLFLQSLSSQAQITATDTSTNNECTLTVSLLTCTPGDELYSTFGHSALLVERDDNSSLVFNYGTFDFDDPSFYTKFAKGKLQYFVSIDELNNFLLEYTYFKRGVTKQVLNLSCEQSQQLLATLFENAREENKYYRYDFTYDNCTTRLRDMIEKITGQPLQAAHLLPAGKTSFRDLIHQYLEQGNQHWGELGIDILLGDSFDKRISNREAMFLPDYLMFALDSAGIDGKKLVKEKKMLLPAATVSSGHTLFTPIVILSALFVLIVLLSVIKSKTVQSFLRIFDFGLFFITGALGSLLLLLWLGTGYSIYKNNFNLLWALPAHVVAALFLFSKKEWVGRYFQFVFYYNIVLLAAWFVLPQQLNVALLPVTALLMVRSYFISKRRML